MTISAAGIALAACGGGSRDPASDGNRPPTITGNPPVVVEAGDHYDFTPSAADPDGQALTFAIANRPAWATFESTTGRLFGVPSAKDVGSYPAIAVRVAQPGTTTVGWTLPVTNVDGTTLTDLAGFRIHYGMSVTTLDRTLDVPGADVTSANVGNLAQGTWYFSVTAYSATGVESALSEVVSRTID